MNNRSLDLGRAFTFPFDDSNWIVKILIGGLVVLLSFLIVPIFIMSGYQLAVIRNTSQGRDVPLPEWDNVGTYLSEGVKLFIGALVYYLPVILLTCCTVGLFAAGVDDNGELNGVGALALCFTCITMLLSFVISLVLPAAVLRFASTGQLSAMFEFGRVWGFVQQNLGNYLIAVLVGMVAGIVAGGIGSATGGLLIPWASWWSSLVQGHLLGQLWQVAGGAGGAQVYGGLDDDFGFSPEKPI